MTCRHAPGDPNCSSSPQGQARAAAYSASQREAAAKRRLDELLARTPNPDEYEIVRHQQVGSCLVLEVQYSSCQNCSFDSRKVMVFVDVEPTDAMYWRRIDPHFADDEPSDRRHAPAPRARFPADPQGWSDAISYARTKGNR